MALHDASLNALERQRQGKRDGRNHIDQNLGGCDGSIRPVRIAKTMTRASARLVGNIKRCFDNVVAPSCFFHRFGDGAEIVIREDDIGGRVGTRCSHERRYPLSLCRGVVCPVSVIWDV